MTDKEKIIDAFSKCIRITDEGYLQSDCEHCPNRTDDWEVLCKDFEELNVEVPWQLAKDMLDLMKEQEPIEPREQEETRTWVVCGNCSQHLISKWSWCPYCGKLVKWE